MGILCVSCSRQGYKTLKSKVILSIPENTMSAPTAQQIQDLLAQNQALMARVNQLEETEAQRTASVKVSKSGNLTLSWIRHGGQTGAGSRGSWLIPSKERDGRTYIRCGGVPATLTMVNGQITITALLPVDPKEQKTFTEKFVMQSEVRVLAPPVKQDGGQTMTPATAAPPYVPAPSPMPASYTPSTPQFTPEMYAEAMKLKAIPNLFSTDEQAINAVKAKYGIK